jgi:hypothetical protein
MQEGQAASSEISFLQGRWSNYALQLEELRESIFSHPFVNRKNGVTAASYLFHQLQAVAFNRVMAPRSHYPRFYLSGAHEPMTYSLGGGNADTQYRQAFLDGRQEYRIWGRKRNARLCMVQVANGYTGEAPSTMDVRTFDFDQISFDSQGCFELTAGPEDRGLNHMRLDPNCDRNCVTVREIFWDWATEFPSEFRVSPVSDLGLQPVMPSVDEISDRLTRCISYMRTMFDEYGVGLVANTIDAVGVNAFLESDILRKTGGAGGNIGTSYYFLAFALDEDDALLIEVDPSECTYWGIQATDSWHQACEPIYHQSSINGYQSVRDRDGCYRIVLSVRDPEVANWLDPVANTEGFLEMRIIGGHFNAFPRASVVPMSELYELLPTGTPRVRPIERAASLRDRRSAFSQRWGY